MPRTAQAVDVHVGARITARRSAMGLSQSALAQRLGVSHQQVQKYEAGANRISASRLSQVALALGAAPGDFFPDPDPASVVGEVAPSLLRFMTATAEGRAVASAFPAIEDRATRLAVARIVEALAAP